MVFLSRPMALAGKELKLYLRDPQMLFFSLALPLVLVSLMVAAFGGETEFNATAYVVNLDQGEAGGEVISRLEAIEGIEVENLELSAVQARLQDASIVNAIVIEENFSEALDSGSIPRIRILQRGNGDIPGQIVNSYAESIALELAGESLTARQVKEMLLASGLVVPEEEIREEVEAMLQQAREEPPVTIVQEPVGSRAEPVDLYLPGIVTMFILFAISLTAVNMVEERKNGTLERLLTTTISKEEMLAGFGLGNVGRGLIQILFLFSLSWLVFQIFTLQSFIYVLAFGAIAVIAASGIGLVIASISRTPEQANWIAVFFTMIMTTLGGSFFDTSNLTGVMGFLTKMTYNYWANDGLRLLIQKGDSLLAPAIVLDMAVLAGIGVVSWALALALFRMRGDAR